MLNDETLVLLVILSVATAMNITVHNLSPLLPLQSLLHTLLFFNQQNCVVIHMHRYSRLLGLCLPINTVVRSIAQMKFHSWLQPCLMRLLSWFPQGGRTPWLPGGFASVASNGQHCRDWSNKNTASSDWKCLTMAELFFCTIVRD